MKLTYSELESWFTRRGNCYFYCNFVVYLNTLELTEQDFAIPESYLDLMIDYTYFSEIQIKIQKFSLR